MQLLIFCKRFFEVFTLAQFFCLIYYRGTFSSAREIFLTKKFFPLYGKRAESPNSKTAPKGWFQKQQAPTLVPQVSEFPKIRAC